MMQPVTIVRRQWGYPDKLIAMSKSGLQNLLGILTFLLVLNLLQPPPVWASPDEKAASEIEYLLEYITGSECRFERNSTLHSGEEAVKHIKRKYDHFRGRIDSAESFIAYSATGSTISGKPYLVYCGKEKPVKSADWLHHALDDYRQARGETRVGGDS